MENQERNTPYDEGIDLPTSFGREGFQWMPLLLVGLYLVLGCLWIIFSDSVLRSLTSSAEAYQMGQTYKGWAFVVVTALLFFFLLRRYQRTIISACDRVESTNRALRAIQNSNQMLLRAPGERELMQKACEGAVECAGYAMAWVGVRTNGESEVIEPIGFYYREGQSPPRELEEGSSPQKLTVQHEVLRTGERNRYNALDAVAKSRRWFDSAVSDGYRSLVVLPINVDGECIGVMSIYDDVPNAFGDEAIQLLDEMAADLSFGIEVSRRNREVREARQALEERERELSTLLSNLPGMAYRCRHDREWTMQFVSEGVTPLTGYDPEDLIDNNTLSYNALIHPDDRKRVHEAVDGALGSQEPFEITYRIQSADGQEKWVWERGRSVVDESGEKEIIEGFITDITEKKRAKEQLQEALSELRETQQQLVEQERQRALRSMASGIAHNFNNALATITGFTDLLLEHPEKLQDTEKALQYVDRIQTAADKAAATVRRLQTFYRSDEGEQSPLNLNTVVQNAVSATQPLWKDEAQAEGKDIDVELDLSEVPDMYGDESELRELLNNLILNAVEAIPENGHVKISTSCMSDRVMLVVQDDGVGMDETTRERCTEPFFTTKVETGAGLGLSTTKGIIKRHSGDYEIESQPEKGSTFRVTFPACQDNAGDASSPAGGVSLPVLDILVAEDDPAQQSLIQEMLEEHGHSVTLASDGDDALKLFQEGSFDIIMTDRAMPRMGGDELAQAIKDTDDNIPIVMLTGFGEVMHCDGETPEGVNVVLPKPANQQRMTDALREAIGISSGDWKVSDT